MYLEEQLGSFVKSQKDTKAWVSLSKTTAKTNNAQKQKQSFFLNNEYETQHPYFSGYFAR